MNLCTWSRISAETQLQKLHPKPQGVILDCCNEQKLQMTKVLAFKHRLQAFSQPRVKFKKNQCVFPLSCLTSLVASSVSSDPTHDGIQPKAAFGTDSMDFGFDNQCSTCISNIKDHFVGDWQKTNKAIKGHVDSESTMSGKAQ